MAEVEGSDGNQYNIPDFALEDTQEKILGILKRSYKLSDSEVKNAQKALSNDNKNSKAQIDALNKLGADIKDAVDGKGSFLGGISDAAAGTVSVLGTLGSVVGGVAAGFGVLATTAAALAVELSKGFGDAILPLAESGAAFGELGRSLKTTVPELMSFGLSVGEAVGAIEGLRTNFTILGADAGKQLIGTFMNITDLGSKYGKSQAEAIEFLQEEMATRQMLGFFQERGAAREAQAAEEMLQTQIDASKILGKSVRELAENVASLFNTDSYKANFARLGPDIADIMRKSFTVMDASSVNSEILDGLAKAMTDPLSATSSEAAIEMFSALDLIAGQVDPGAADEIRQNINNFRNATAAGDEIEAEKYQKLIEQQTINLLGGISGLSDAQQKQLIAQGEVNDALMGAMANQNATRIASGRFRNAEEAELAKAAQTASYFNNIIDLISGSFDTLYMSVKSGLSPALESFTKALGRMDDPESPIRRFRDRLGEIGEKIVKKFNDIFGGSEKAEGAVGIVNSVLDTLGDAIDWAANKFLDFADLFVTDDSTPLMDKLGAYFMDLFSDLATVVMDGLAKVWDNVSITDILTGNTDSAAVGRAEDKLKLETGKLEAMKNAGTIDEDEYNKRMSKAKADSAQEIFDRAEDKGYDSQETLKLLEKAGLAIEDISSAQLADLFPDPKALEEAIIKSGGSQEQYTELANTISKQLQKESDQKSSLFSGGLKEELKTQSEAFKNAADTIIKQDTSEADAKAEQRNAPGEGVLSQRDKREAELRAQFPTASPGTPPMASAGNQVMTKMPEEETSTETPTSTDGTKTQSVKSEPIGGTDDNNQLVDDLMKAINLSLGPTLRNIDTNTKNTSKGIASLPDALN